MAGKLNEKVLLAGKEVFWQTALQRLFAKEGWDFYVLTEDFPAPEEVFRIHNVPVVLYVLGKAQSVDDWAPDLNRILAMCRSHKVRRFYLIVSLEAEEKDRALAESIAAAWRGEEMTITFLRLPEIYGYGESPKDGIVADWLEASQRGESRPGFADLDEKREFLYVDDGVYAVFRTVSRDFAGESLDIVSGQPASAKELAEIVSDVTSKPVNFLLGEASFAGVLPDPAPVHSEIGWRPKYSLKEGVSLAFKESKNMAEVASTASRRERRTHKVQEWKGKMIPFLENLAGALLMVLIAYFQEGTIVNPAIYFDMNFVYIGAMGILYGKSQSLIAMVLSSAILLGVLLKAGANAVALLYMPEHLLHFVAYLFVAVFTGYFADARAFERQSNKWHEEQARERYDFLRSLYDECVVVKDRLYRQIVNSDDSIGRLYRIIRHLDSVATENIFTQAAGVTADVMGVEDIAVYVLSKDGYYLRQKVRKGRLAFQQPRSLRVEEHDYLKNLIAEKNTYINRELVKDTPDLAAPILYRGGVIGVVELFGLDFKHWSLYNLNLFSITMRLISASMGRAYQYEAEAQEKRYHNGTRILRSEAFAEILQELRERRKLQGEMPLGVLKVPQEGRSLDELDSICGRVTRNEDFLGEYQGSFYILLPDADESVCNMVIERLAKEGVAAVLEEKVL